MALSSLQTSLRNSWRIACRSNQLESKRPTSTQIFEHKIVLIRDKWGRVTALKDKESVRGFPISLGFSNQRTRALESFYDKYRYDSDGKLVSVPGLKVKDHEWGAEIDPSVRIPKYHVAEADGYVWVWTGKEAPTDEPMAIPGVTDYIWTQETLLIDCDPTMALQLEMDWPSSYAQHRMSWAHRRALIGMQKPLALDQKFEVRTNETGFELFSPPTKASGDAKLRQAVTSTFALPDRVVHQKMLKRRFWRGFGDFTSVAHFVPVVDPITGKVTTRAEYMWTPFILPGYAFQRNKLATVPAFLSKLFPSRRRADKATLEVLQHNINHWNAVDALDVNPGYVPIEVVPVANEGKSETVAKTDEATQSSPSTSAHTHPINGTSKSLTIGARACFGPDVLIDSPSDAVLSVIQLAAADNWNSDSAHIVVPEGRQVGSFRVTHEDS